MKHLLIAVLANFKKYNFQQYVQQCYNLYAYIKLLYIIKFMLYYNNTMISKSNM